MMPNAALKLPPVDLNRVDDFSTWFFQDDMKYPSPPFHGEIYELMDEKYPRVCICAPRVFAKSFIAVKFNTLHHICVGPKRRIFILSNTGDLGIHWIKEISSEIDNNEWLRAAYGDLRTSKWTQDHIICRRRDGTETEIVSKGWGSQVRGFHPDLVICDDLENSEMVRSSEQRAKQLDWFNKEVINMLDLFNTQLIYIGTNLHELSLINNVLHRKDYETRIYKAIQPDGTSLWPDAKPIEKLLERKDEIGALAFASEYQNEPQSSENPIFIPEWFKPYDSESAAFKEEVRLGLRTVIAIDPAISRKETADYTAIVTLSSTFDKESKHYIRPGGVVRGHWPISRQVTEIVRLYDKFKASAVIIETVAYQEALAQELRRYCDDNRRNISIREVKPDKDKERRAHAVTSPIERGFVYVDETDAMTQRLIEECFMFPTGDRDDLVDAFVYALSEQVGWSKRKTTKAERSRVGDAW